jgi:polyhydroxyalkanoate synthase
MRPMSITPKTDVPVLPCPAHVANSGEDRRGAVPGDYSREGPAEAGRRPEGEAYQADRAFHAMLARLSGGISPVALLLAYTDWLSHLATSPQRQIEISQEALMDARRVFEAAQHFFSPGQRPWTLVKPQAQDKRFGRPEW